MVGRGDVLRGDRDLDPEATPVRDWGLSEAWPSNTGPASEFPPTIPSSAGGSGTPFGSFTLLGDWAGDCVNRFILWTTNLVLTLWNFKRTSLSS